MQTNYYSMRSDVPSVTYEVSTWVAVTLVNANPTAGKLE
jgi:hypothetical protein